MSCALVYLGKFMIFQRYFTLFCWMQERKDDDRFLNKQERLCMLSKDHKNPSGFVCIFEVRIDGLWIRPISFYLGHYFQVLFKIYGTEKNL
jgi:hypothetical protein